jgi:hypothetical protein
VPAGGPRKQDRNALVLKVPHYLRIPVETLLERGIEPVDEYERLVGGNGSNAVAPGFAFDVRISRIRLSDWLHRQVHASPQIVE